MSIPTVTAGEPTFAGVALVTIGTISGMHIFSAFGGAFIGAGILVAVVHNQLSGVTARVRRFAVSALAAPLVTLALVELAQWRGVYPGPFVVSVCAMILAFLAWGFFTQLHNRSNRIAARAIDHAISMIGKNDGTDLLDSCYIDSGRASYLLARIKADQERRAKAAQENQDSNDSSAP